MPAASARLVVLLLLLGSAPAFAGSGGTLDRLVEDLDGKLALVLRRPDAGAQDLALMMTAAPGTPPRLAQALEELLLSRLGGHGLRSVQRLEAGQAPSEASRLAGQQGFERLLTVEVTLTSGHLHVQGELRSCDRSLWRDLVQPARGSLHHLHASVREDAEVRAYLGATSPGLLRVSPRRHRLAGEAILALAMGDLDSDGKQELLALRPRSLTVLRLGGRDHMLKVAAEVPLLGTPASARPRRAMGTLLALDLDGDGRSDVLLRTSEHAAGQVLRSDDGKLLPAGALDGYPLALLEDEAGRRLLRADAMDGMDLFDGTSLRLVPLPSVTPRSGSLTEAPIRPDLGPPARDLSAPPGVSDAGVRSPGSAGPTLTHPFYGLKAVRIANREGRPRRYLALLDSSGRLQVHDGDLGTASLTLPRVGLAFDMSDLTDDGSLELAVTGPGLAEEDDQISVLRLDKGRVSRPLWSSAGLGGVVTALCHGDLDGDGRLELVAAVSRPDPGPELLVLQ